MDCTFFEGRSATTMKTNNFDISICGCDDIKRRGPATDDDAGRLAGAPSSSSSSRLLVARCCSSVEKNATDSAVRPVLQGCYFCVGEPHRLQAPHPACDCSRASLTTRQPPSARPGPRAVPASLLPAAGRPPTPKKQLPRRRSRRQVRGGWDRDPGDRQRERERGRSVRRPSLIAGCRRWQSVVASDGRLASPQSVGLSRRLVR